MAGDLGRLTATLEARAEKFDLTLQRATQRMDRLAAQTEAANLRMARSSARLDAALTGVSRGFRLLAAAVPVAAFGLFVRRQFDAIDKLGDLSQQTGIAAAELRQLQVGLELSGGTAEQAGEGLLTFSRNLAQAEAGTGRMAGLLKKLDPAFLETLNNADSTGEGLRLVADRIAGAATEQEKLAIATAAFGPAGRQFVLLLRDGADGVDALTERLAGLGIGFDADLVAAVQRADDAFRTLKNTLSDQFTKGLFGVGEGMASIADALDDQAIANMGKLALEMGRFAGFLAGVSVDVLGSVGEFITLLRGGADFDIALSAGGQPLGDVVAELREVEEAIASIERSGGRVGHLSGAQLDARLVELRNAREALDTLVRQRFDLPSESRTSDLGSPELGPPSSSIAPGARAPDTKLAAAHESFLKQHETFIAAMRKSSLGVLTEAEEISLKLTETLGKIDKAVAAGAIKATEGVEFRAAAIREATDAIQQAELEAFEKQSEQVGDFISTFGSATVSQAEIVAEKIRDALDKIEGLSPEIRAELEALGQVSVERASAAETSSVQRELLQRAARAESGSVFGLSKDLERELARAEAIAEKSALDDKIRAAFSGGDPGELQAALDRNQEILEEELADINSEWDETLSEIGAFGEQVFGDMVEGWVQGADVSFDGILKSFAAMLLKMEAQAIAADIASAIAGKSGESASLIGGILGGLLGLLGSGTTSGGVESFASGGLVKHRPGGRIIRVGEAGEDEWVIPESAIDSPNFAGQADASRSVARSGGPGVALKFEQTVAPGTAASKPKVERGPDGEWVIRQAVTSVMARDLSTNGPMAQAFQPNGPTSGLR